MIDMENNAQIPGTPQHDAKLHVMRCFDCKFLRKMKSGKYWCINDKSWLVGWITDIKEQGCEHHSSVNSA